MKNSKHLSNRTDDLEDQLNFQVADFNSKVQTITNLQTNLNTLTSTQSQHTQSIAQINSALSADEQQIQTNKNNITMLSGNVSTLQSQVSTNTNSISANTSALQQKENVSNKKTSLSQSSTDDDYPSAKCVYDALQTKQGTLTTTQLNAVNSGVNSSVVEQVGTNASNISSLQSGKQDSLSTAQLNAVNSGITSSLVSQIGTNQSAISSLQSSKQDALTFDSSPTQNSNNPVKSGGVYSALSEKVNASSLATVATSGSYNDLSNKPAIPSAVTSVNGLSGGTLTSPLTLVGGDGANASKMILDYNSSTGGGQITDGGTSTLFGRTGSNNLITGHGSYALQLRGSATRPTYNGNNLALFSDVPTTTSSVTQNSTAALTSGGAYTALAGKQNTLTAGTNITIENNVISAAGGSSVTVDSALSTTSTNPVQNSVVTCAINGKQPTINSSNKLSADLINDSNTTNKFVTSSEKTTWNGKQNALTFDNSPTQNSTNPVKSGGVFTALSNKEDTSNKTTTLSSSSTNTQYPSAKAVFDAISAISGGGGSGGSDWMFAIKGVDKFSLAKSGSDQVLANKQFYQDVCTVTAPAGTVYYVFTFTRVMNYTANSSTTGLFTLRLNVNGVEQCQLQNKKATAAITEFLATPYTATGTADTIQMQVTSITNNSLASFVSAYAVIVGKNIVVADPPSST